MTEVQSMTQVPAQLNGAMIASSAEQERVPTEAEVNFSLAQRMATAFSKSSLVPDTYKNNMPNCLIAIEIAQRTGSSPLMVAQNLHVIQGRPSWSSSYIIAAINSCGRFGPLRFRMTGEGDSLTCVAWTTDNANGEVLEGPPVSMAMAKAEGWVNKSGSKWKTMPDLMIRYRAAAFFGRLYAPEILMGMQSSEEVIDVSAQVIPQSQAAAASGDAFQRAAAGVDDKALPAASNSEHEEPTTSAVEEKASTETADDTFFSDILAGLDSIADLPSLSEYLTKYDALVIKECDGNEARKSEWDNAVKAKRTALKS